MTIRQVKRANDLYAQAAGPKPQAVIWSPTGNDRDTVLSVALLTRRGVEITVHTLDNKPEVQAEFGSTFVSTTTVTLPQIVVDGVKIGGFRELENDSTYSMKAASRATVSAVKPTKFGNGSGITPISSATVIRSSIAAPKKK